MISTAPAQATDPGQVLAVFADHRAIHAYGIVDAVQLWDASRWWVRGGAAVGLVHLPAIDAPVVYAISAVHGSATLALLWDLVDELPARFEITGPVGLAERLAPTHRATRTVPSVKMGLLRPDMLPAPDPQVRALSPDDLDAVARFRDDAGLALPFLRADLLGTGRHAALVEDGRVVALAGVHLIDVGEGIAVIGDVATLPGRRGEGLARRVVGALSRRLCDEVAIVALNVARDNAAARALYERLGFMPLMEYEEAELVRR